MDPSHVFKVPDIPTQDPPRPLHPGLHAKHPKRLPKWLLDMGADDRKKLRERHMKYTQDRSAQDLELEALEQSIKDREQSFRNLLRVPERFSETMAPHNSQAWKDRKNRIQTVVL